MSGSTYEIHVWSSDGRVASRTSLPDPNANPPANAVGTFTFLGSTPTATNIDTLCDDEFGPVYPGPVPSTDLRPDAHANSVPNERELAMNHITTLRAWKRGAIVLISVVSVVVTSTPAAAVPTPEPSDVPAPSPTSTPSPTVTPSPTPSVSVEPPDADPDVSPSPSPTDDATDSFA